MTSDELNSADMIANVGFNTMMDLLAGKKPAQKNSSPPVVVVTKENAKQGVQPEGAVLGEAQREVVQRVHPKLAFSWTTTVAPALSTITVAASRCAVPYSNCLNITL